MIKRIVFLSIFLFFISYSAIADPFGSGSDWGEGSLKMGNFSIVGDATNGLSFDPDNDGINEIGFSDNGICVGGAGNLSLAGDIYLGGQDIIWGGTILSFGDNGLCNNKSLSVTDDLFVGDDIYGSGDFTILSPAAGGCSGFKVFSDTGDTAVFHNLGVGNDLIVTGNVGIGTMTPTARLNIQGTNNKLLLVKCTDVFDLVTYNIVATGWTNITAAAGETKGTVSGDVLNVVDDYLYMGKTTQFSSIYIDIGTARSATASSLFEYSTGEGTWATLTVTDGTTNLTVDGAITFTPPGDWAQTTINGSAPYFGVRIGTVSGTFTDEPTVYLVVPNSGSNVVEMYANNNDDVTSFRINAQGNIYLGENSGVTTTLSGPLAISGSLSGASTSTFSSTITDTLTATGGLYSGGFITVAPAATSLIRANNSPVIRLGSNAWNGSVAQISNMDILVRPYTFGGTTSSRMVFKNTTVAGVANMSELMTLNDTGNLSTIGTTYGSETIQDSTMDTAPTTNWTVLGDWSYTTGDFTFTYSGGTGSITQDASRFLVPAVANRWYRLRYVVGVLGPAGTEMWLGSEFADRITRMHCLTTGTYDVFFKSNSSPGNLVIYASANATSGLRIDSVSIMEVQSGNIMASGLFTGGGNSGIKIDSAGNVGIGTTAPAGLLHIDQSSTTGAIPVLTLDQADVSEELIKLIGTSANGVLTQSIVEAADVGTATIAGYIEVYIQDDGNQIADGSYYLPFYSIVAP